MPPDDLSTLTSALVKAGYDGRVLQEPVRKFRNREARALGAPIRQSLAHYVSTLTFDEYPELPDALSDRAASAAHVPVCTRIPPRSTPKPDSIDARVAGSRA